jgi:hypothetical protein
MAAIFKRRLVADVKSYLCCQVCGTAQSDDRSRPQLSIFRPADRRDIVRLYDWRRSAMPLFDLTCQLQCWSPRRLSNCLQPCAGIAPRSGRESCR